MKKQQKQMLFHKNIKVLSLNEFVSKSNQFVGKRSIFRSCRCHSSLLYRLYCNFDIHIKMDGRSHRVKSFSKHVVQFTIFVFFFCCAHFDWMFRFVCQSLENNFIILISLSCFIWLSKPYMEPLLLLLLLFRLPLFWIFSNFRQFFAIFFVQLKNRSEWISLKIFHTIIMIFLLPNSKSTCEFKQFSFIFFQQNNKGKLVSN